MELSKAEMYQAILEKDTSFEGLFFTAVKTIGIFCKPSCPARKPKIENVEFLFSSKDCLLKGYRPCKVCKPLEPVKSMPLEIRKLLKEMVSNPDLKINDRGLPIKSRLKCWETQWLSVQWPVPMG